MPKIKCELEGTHEQLDDILRTIEKFAPSKKALCRAEDYFTVEKVLIEIRAIVSRIDIAVEKCDGSYSRVDIANELRELCFLERDTSQCITEKK